MNNHLRHFVGGALLFSAIVSLTFLNLWVSQEQQQNTEIRNAFANIAAQQFSDALLKKDLAHMQFTLSRIVQHLPGHHIQWSAQVLDEERRLLVEASTPQENRGNTLNKGAQHTREKQRVTTPILFHNTTLGYFNLASTRQVPWLIRWRASLTLIPVGIVLAISLLYLYSFGRKRVKVTTVGTNANTQTRRNDITAETRSIPQPTMSDKPFSKENGDSAIYCQVYFKNATLLAQQLDNDTYQKLLCEWDNTLKSICNLYSGVLCPPPTTAAEVGNEATHNPHIPHRVIQLNVTGDHGSLLFQSVCCAYLVRQLSHTINHVPLEIHQVISESNIVHQSADDDESITLALKNTHLLESLHEKVALRLPKMGVDADTSQQTFAVDAVLPPYEKLLVNQSCQLLKR